MQKESKNNVSLCRLCEKTEKYKINLCEKTTHISFRDSYYMIVEITMIFKL